MIPILYPASATTFGNNGLGGLPDATACTVTEERNGEYYLEMTYPQTGLHYAEIAIDRIILATPADGADAQPFRIVHISRPIDGLVTIEAQHVSYALAATVALPVDITSKYAQAAFDAIKAQAKPETPFTFSSPVQNSLAAHYVLQQPVSLRAAIGGMEGSILDLYGGELEWNRWNVNLWSARGSDSGVTIEYGKNMTAITADTDARSLVTGAIAFAKKDDEVRCGDPAYAENADLYASRHMTILDLSSNDSFPTVSELTAAAQQYVAASSVGKLATTIEVSFVPLWQTANANKLAQLQRLHLCDTVTVIHPGLRIKEKAKVVRTVYDVLRDRYDSITVGTIRRNVADTISSLMSSSDSVSNLDTADRIVEIGTSGKWTYRKFASGIAECWGVFSTTELKITTQWGNGIYSNSWMDTDTNKNCRKYPFAFVEEPCVYAAPATGSGNFWLTSNSENDTGTRLTHAPAYQCTRVGTVTAKMPTIYYHIIGRWK